MAIIFNHYINTENVEFSNYSRQPMNIMYTMMTEVPIRRGANILESIFGHQTSFDIFGEHSILNIFDGLDALLDQSLQNDQIQKDKATREMIQQLGPYRRVNESSNMLKEECSICLESFMVNEGYRTLPCGHDFHKKCIDKWFLEGSQECPMCRKNAWGIEEKENQD